MDPLTIAVAAATVVLTKMLEKTGETMGDKALDAGGNLLNLLRRKSPDTVAKLEQAAEQKTLPDVIDAEIIEEVKQLANQDAEVKASVETVADVADSAGVVNKAKLAEKIGVLNQGYIAKQENTINL